MVDFSAIASGFRQQGIDDRATRKDIAETFAQFRKDNPHATLEDMQNQMNILSGGRNYLRAGLPSADVLQGIATSNLEAKKQSELETGIKNWSDKNEIRNILEERANKFLETALFDVSVLGMSEDNVTAKLDTMKDDFTKQLTKEVGELDLNSKELINNVFSRDNASIIREKAIDKRMPKAREEILKYFKTYHNEKKTDFTALDVADLKKLAVETGIPVWRLEDEVQSLGAQFKLDLGKAQNSFIATATPIIEESMKKYELEWRNGSKTADEIKTLMETELDALAAREGITLTENDKELITGGALSNLQGTWKAAKKQEVLLNDQWIQDKKNTILGSVSKQLQEGSGNAYDAFERGGINELKKYVGDMINQALADDTVEELFGANKKSQIASRILNELSSELELTSISALNKQEKNFANIRKAQEDKVLSIIKEEKTASADIGTKYFGKGQGEYAFTQMKNGKLAGGAAETALNNLAKTYYINDGLANFFINALRNYTPADPDKLVTPQEIQDYFLSVAGDNLQKWTERTKDLTSSIKDGVPERIMPFLEWQKQFQLDADNALGEVTKNIDELTETINSGNVTELTLPQLNLVLEQIQSVANEVTAGINQAGQSQAIWVQDGQESQWDWNKTDPMKADLLGKLDEMKKKVEELKANDAVTSFTATPTRGELEFDEEVKSVISGGGTLAQQKGNLQDLFASRVRELITNLQNAGMTTVTMPTYDRDYGMNPLNQDFWGGQDWLRKLLQFEDATLKVENPGLPAPDIKIVDKFLRDQKSLWLLTQSKERINAFYNDPIAYIKSLSDANSSRTIDIFEQLNMNM